MTSKDWLLLLIGGSIGAIIGLLITLAFSWIKEICRKQKLRKYFKPYNGIYKVRTKGGEASQLLSVKVSHEKLNILKIEFETENNGPAVGHIIADNITLKYGKAFYHHTNDDKKDLSGIYDLLFIDNGIIHAKLLYIKGASREEIIEQYIWEKFM